MVIPHEGEPAVPVTLSAVTEESVNASQLSAPIETSSAEPPLQGRSLPVIVAPLQPGSLHPHEQLLHERPSVSVAAEVKHAD